MATSLALVVGIAVVLLPFYVGTKTYPLAVVQGNSMYPTLQTGDLVVFKANSPGRIENGTIIVFVQSRTGVTFLDSLTKPIVIHRVIGSFADANGSVYYSTKGDNNALNDPSAVDASHVLGVPLLIVPKVGLIFLFLGSAQGLVAVVGVITLLYLGSYEEKLRQEKAKDAFLGDLARMVLHGELSQDAFGKIELAVKYFTSVNLVGIGDVLSLTILKWIEGCDLKKGWKITKVECPSCFRRVNCIEGSSDQLLALCPECARTLGHAWQGCYSHFGVAH